MERFDDPGGPIRVQARKAFAISLEGNPTTGYIWQANFESHYLVIVGQTFEPASEAVGAGGREVFQFQARTKGTTEISFECRRPWGGKPLDTRNLQVVIT
jgi:inhibitor of cysteine peptidase